MNDQPHAEIEAMCACYERVPDLLPTHDCDRVQADLRPLDGGEPAWWWSTRLGRPVTAEEARLLNAHCGRGPCYLGAGHEGPCVPGGALDPRRDEVSRPAVEGGGDV